jgi:hypothetical protein
MQANPDLGKRWDGDTVCIFGSGNSLADEQIEYAKSLQCRYIAVNDTYKRIPFSDVMYACDGKWWRMKYEVEFSGEKWTQDLASKRAYGLNWVLGRNKPGLGLECVHFGGNSGYQAINLAFLWGASRIWLFGFDCKPVDGKSHWFGNHPVGLNQVQDFRYWLDSFETLAKDLKEHGVEVRNFSPDSALTCFKQGRID